MDRALYAASLLGVTVSAVGGALAAGRKRFDWLGVLSIATVAAIGGGTIRDLLLDRHPIFWIRDSSYLVISLLAALATLLYVRFRRPPFRALLIADALGLAFFTISGAQLTEQLRFNGLVVALMGMITGAAGGVLRDVLSGEAPLMFREGELYGTASLLGAVTYLLCERFGAPTPSAALVGMLTVACLRFAAIRWRIKLPVFALPDDN